MLPLEGVLVLEFCQFMAGPSAGLKLADLGARVIKIERPEQGEGGRQIVIKNLYVDDSSTLVFHTINRNKESYTANLKDEEDLNRVKKLIEKVDVLTHNFRPGVMEKIGLDYETVKKINDKIIYASVSGYGTTGPWLKKPGQDLLAQCLSGVTYLSGDQDDNPTPMGLAVADIYCGSHLVQGILAALLRRDKTSKGALIEVSLFESMLDFQFEAITTYLNEGKKSPVRAKRGSAHPYLKAPYGIYKTKDAFLAVSSLVMKPLSDVLDIPELLNVSSPDEYYTRRDEFMSILQDVFIKETTQHWLDFLEPHDIWCSDVFTYEQLINHEGYKTLEFDQILNLEGGEKVHTTRCPIKIDDKALFSSIGAPKVGEHNEKIIKEFDL